MPFNQISTIRYYYFSGLCDSNLIHGVITRQGGVSPAPWDSMNLGGTVGDLRENIVENRKRIFKAFNRSVESIFDTWQVHGTKVICVDEPRDLQCEPKKADAIITNRSDITLFMRFADCVPVMLYDPVKKVVGIVHAGWQGTTKKICQVAVREMSQKYGTNPGDVFAGIGPSIGPDHYMVQNDVVEIVKNEFGENAEALLYTQNGSTFFDLWKTNKLVLEQSGVSNIEIAGECTACNTKDWYSHREENGKTGRFGALIALC